jgi:hypothetical protein
MATSTATIRRTFSAILAGTTAWLVTSGSVAEQSAPIPADERATFDSPSLLYSTTFGRGAGEARDVVVDAQGNTIFAGNTTEFFEFPLVNAVDDEPGSEGQEGWVAKINAAGDDLVFSTYLGGNGDEWVTDIDVDANGNVYVVGTTNASDFPTTPGALQPSTGGAVPGSSEDAFVTKLDPMGNIVWSTYLGGDKNDRANGVRVGADGTVYVVGGTSSFGFPTADAIQEECDGGQFDLCNDAFIVRLATNGGSLLFGTFLGGGSFGDVACSVDVDENGNIFVAGQFSADDFPFVDAFEDSHAGGFDNFVAKYGAGGATLEWASGLGGSGNEALCTPQDRGPTIILDGAGDAFVATLTDSTDLSASGRFQETNAGATDGYLAKIASEGTFEWGSYLGGENSESIRAISVTADGSPVAVGFTTSTDFPVTDDALDEGDCPSSPTSPCSADVFVTVFSADGTALDFSTYLGGSDTEFANGVAVSANGTIYVAGMTQTELWTLVDPLPAEYLGFGNMQPFTVQIGDGDAPIPGDVNGDGRVTASDALAGLNAALGIQQCLLCICDLNGDGSVSATDALIILNLAIGIPVATNPPTC